VVSELPTLQAREGAGHGSGPEGVALVMGGGGARAAYQVGFLRCLARTFPELRVPWLTGVSAGAINAAHLATHPGSFLESVDELTRLWERLRVEDVFRVDTRSLFLNLLRWGVQLVSGGLGGPPRVRGLVDTSPLRRYLHRALHTDDGELTGIARKLEDGRLRALALSTSNYSTGQSVTWVQGHEIREWTRPRRSARRATLTVDHVMASAALPLFFPAVELEGEWYGDGGIRLTAPLSPALHLGADRIVAISTRYHPTAGEARATVVRGYPPPAQVVGILLNSVFLDLLDHDAMHLERLNRLLEKLPEEEREGMRPVRLLIQRPSRDLAALANRYEPRLPSAFRFLTRGLGTRETRSPDFLSLVMFQPDYLRALMEVGEADAQANTEAIGAFLEEEG
jgi:NTE family protein